MQWHADAQRDAPVALLRGAAAGCIPMMQRAITKRRHVNAVVHRHLNAIAWLLDNGAAVNADCNGLCPGRDIDDATAGGLSCLPGLGAAMQQGVTYDRKESDAGSEPARWTIASEQADAW